MQRAAAVLVTKANRVLAFHKHDKVGLSFPCGKLEPDESLEEAAIRECFEETGLKVRITSPFPYTSFDNIGGCLVSTFQAEVVGGSLFTNSPLEGTPCWASARELIAGPYSHYNQRALNHFGIPVPIVGKFHSHLTCAPMTQDEAERAARLVGGKLTTIVLERDGRSQVDPMITHHYVCGARGLEDEHDVLALLKARAQQLKDSGIDVLRVKLEHEPYDPISNPIDVNSSFSRVYVEVHIKCRVAFGKRGDLIDLAKEYDWHPSSNPWAQTDTHYVQFINKRFYNAMDPEVIDSGVDTIIEQITDYADIAEIKIETAIYDSNASQDAWWMAR